MYKGTAYEQELAMQRWKVSLAPCVPCCPLAAHAGGGRGLDLSYIGDQRLAVWSASRHAGVSDC